MPSICELKEYTVADAPLLVFDCTLTSGATEHWSTHRIAAGGLEYAARVLEHNLFDIQTASDQGIDGAPRLTLSLANADSHFSEIERAGGWKGARLTAAFLFYDLRNGVALTDRQVVFQGICNPPETIGESIFRLSAMNRMNLQRLLLPQIRVQRRCPWEFPSNAGQRAEAVGGGSQGKYSRYYRCGYSVGAPEGTGAPDGAAPFATCNYTRADCEARGMARRFGGLEFVPPAIAVRGYGKDWSTSALAVNQARYNDFVPIVYGTAWYSPLVVFARNDGNLTRMQALLGAGEMAGVLTVLVNDVEIPLGRAGANMTGTGWYNVMTPGTRDGAYDDSFRDAAGQPAGDPFGSMAYLSIAVPNRLNSGTTLPQVKVLAQGLKLPWYGMDGMPGEEQFSNNPAWILLDVLRRSGWGLDEINIRSFAAAAAVCDEPVATTDLNGNAITVPRFGCNVVLRSRRSAGDVVRGIRNAGRLLLTYGEGGRLEARVEDAAARETPSKPEWSNSTEQLNGGWPSYEFGDGSNGTSGILRRENGASSVRVWSRSIADTPNRLTVEFQDGLNGYQQDSYSLVNADDVARAGQEISATLQALGIPNYDQAGRLLKFQLDKSVRGNAYIEFETSVKGFGVRPGDLITVTYLKEGFVRQAFRVVKISPRTNFRTISVTAQIHDDAWYGDGNGQTGAGGGGGGQAAAGAGLPLPLVGTAKSESGAIEFGVKERAESTGDGGGEVKVALSFATPAQAQAGGPGIPLVSLAARSETGGSLKADTYYYAVSAVDAAGRESGLSFLARATVAANGGTVTLSGLSFAPETSAFRVYRGPSPAELRRIAANQTPATDFIDAGLDEEMAGPPDRNFDHANFYWRMELQPETQVTSHGNTSLGNASLGMTENAYRGATARITRGTGEGQERAITANDATGLTVAPPWDVEPDGTSFFAVAEAGWHFGAVAKSSPVEFAVPNRPGEVVQLSGRAANVNDLESAPELAIVTRWQIGGTAGDDGAVPAAPKFGVGPGPHGSVQLTGVSFPDLSNTRTISSATLTLHYRDELQGTAPCALAVPAGAGDSAVTLDGVGPAAAGAIVQIEGEILRVTAVNDAKTAYTVERGIHGSAAAAHAAQSAVWHLQSKVAIAPFPSEFFGSPYSGSWSFAVPLPEARVGSAELVVTNRYGSSPAAGICLTHNDDAGLRTLSGGQYSIQVDGYLAVDSTVSAPLVVEAAHAVRDVFAVLGTAADAPVGVRVNLNGAAYCTLNFAAGMTVSSAANGNALPPLPSGARITASVLSTGATNPGADLTVVVRL